MLKKSESREKKITSEFDEKIEAKKKKMKKYKKKLLEAMQKKTLKELAKKEKISEEGKKEELIEKIAEKIKYEKVTGYYRELKKKHKFDIFASELVPKHRILSENEKKELLNKYGVKPLQLPRILSTDPVILELGAKPGDIVEITRKSRTIGESKYYRIVIPGEKLK